uniref:Uncharacterized protein n=1 Tax=Timema douglasi TaxID=61478 RepID=A0A7R8VFX8_TIMDO|nr:unnamed protein product [Timema douglasi]
MREVALRVSHSSLMSSDRMKPRSGDWASYIKCIHGKRCRRRETSCTTQNEVDEPDKERCREEGIEVENSDGNYRYLGMYSSPMASLVLTDSSQLTFDSQYLGSMSPILIAPNKLPPSSQYRTPAASSWSNTWRAVRRKPSRQQGGVHLPSHKYCGISFVTVPKQRGVSRVQPYHSTAPFSKTTFLNPSVSLNVIDLLNFEEWGPAINLNKPRRPPGNPREHMKTLDKQVKLKRKRELQEYVEAQEASMEHRRAIFKSQCLGLCEAKRNMKVEIKRLKLEGENIKNTLGDVGNMLEYPIMDPDKDKENTPIERRCSFSESKLIFLANWYGAAKQRSSVMEGADGDLAKKCYYPCQLTPAHSTIQVSSNSATSPADTPPFMQTQVSTDVACPHQADRRISPVPVPFAVVRRHLHVAPHSAMFPIGAPDTRAMFPCSQTQVVVYLASIVQASFIVKLSTPQVRRYTKYKTTPT